MAQQKNPYAVALGRRGAKVRYDRMTTKERRALAQRAALARWAKRKRGKQQKSRGPSLAPRRYLAGPRSLRSR